MNTTNYAILGLLYHEPLSGYDVQKRIKGSLALFWDAGFGQIYPALQTMQGEGLITGEAGQKGGRSRTVYTITEQGRTAVRAWLSEPVARERVHYEILLKLFFGSAVAPEHNIQTIEEFQNRYAGLEMQLESYERNLRAVLDESPEHLYYLLTVLFGRRIYRAYLDWADEAVALLAGLKQAPIPAESESQPGGGVE